MYQSHHHVEEYYIPRQFGKNNYGDHKINPNDIINCFFTEEGKPNFENLFSYKDLISLSGYEIPKNKNMARVFKAKFHTQINVVVNWLSEEFALNILAIKISDNGLVCYGFSKKLNEQAASLDRRIERRDKAITHVKDRKQISNPKALKLIKNEEDRCLEHKAVI